MLTLQIPLSSDRTKRTFGNVKRTHFEPRSRSARSIFAIKFLCVQTQTTSTYPHIPFITHTEPRIKPPANKVHLRRFVIQSPLLQRPKVNGMQFCETALPRMVDQTLEMARMPIADGKQWASQVLVRTESEVSSRANLSDCRVRTMGCSLKNLICVLWYWNLFDCGRLIVINMEIYWNSWSSSY